MKFWSLYHDINSFIEYNAILILHHYSVHYSTLYIYTIQCITPIEREGF